MEPIPAPERRSARDRLLDAAGDLFNEQGVNTVGIDRLIERAGVAKASLYDIFGSKEELIRAYLVDRQVAREARIMAKLADYATPRERLLGVFDAQHDVISDPQFRGCAFIRASAETRTGDGVKSTVDRARAWQHALFSRLASEAGARDPASLAKQLVLLYDGALVAAQMDGNRDAAQSARAIASTMLDAATAR